MDSAWKVEIDRATSEEWSHMLEQFDDANLYQTYSYGRVRWGAKNLSHLVLKRDGEVRAMAQLRIFRPTRFKFGMAYLRWGPVWERSGRPPDAAVAMQVARCLEQEYAGNRKLFLHVLPNAFIGSSRSAAIESAFAQFTRESVVRDNTYRTFVVDLSASLRDLRSRLQRKWRNQLTRSEANNLKIIHGSGPDEFQKFALIYMEMRKRKAFKTKVDIGEFWRIQENLPNSQRMHVFICERKGTPVAGLVTSAMGASAIYLLGATSAEGLNSKGSYLLQWALIHWLKENGVRWYDLGGIDPERNPGVYHFKRGLSGVDVCQINPFVMSSGAVSSTIVRAGLAVRRAAR